MESRKDDTDDIVLVYAKHSAITLSIFSAALDGHSANGQGKPANELGKPVSHWWESAGWTQSETSAYMSCGRRPTCKNFEWVPHRLSERLYPHWYVVAVYIL